MYRKKTQVEAILAQRIIDAYKTDPKNGTIPPWAISAYESGQIVAITENGFTIKNSGANLSVHASQMVVLENGKLYPWDPAVFNETYEPASIHEDANTDDFKWKPFRED